MRYFQGFDRAYLLLIYPVLRMTWPVLQYRFSNMTMVPFMALWFFHIFFGNNPARIRTYELKNYFIGSLVAIAAYLFLPKLIGQSTFSAYIAMAGVVQFLFMFSIVHYSLTRGKIKELKFATCCVFFSLLWMGFMAFRHGSSYVEFGAARMTTAITQANAHNASIDAEALAAQAASSGMGTAASAYICAFVIPLFIYSFFMVRGRVRKFSCIILSYACYLNIKYSGINTPFMVLGAGLVLVLFIKIFRNRQAILFTGVLMALFFISFAFNPKIISFMSAPLSSLAEATASLPQFSMRCASMADTVRGVQGTYAAERYQLQVTSARSFINGNWLLGGIAGPHRIGGHSELLDCLAKFGLLGLFVMCMFFVYYLKYCNALARLSLGPRWLYAPYVYIGAWIFSSVPNPANLGAPIMMLVIPGMGVFYKEFEERWGIE